MLVVLAVQLATNVAMIGRSAEGTSTKSRRLAAWNRIVDSIIILRRETRAKIIKKSGIPAETIYVRSLPDKRGRCLIFGGRGTK